MNYFSVIPVERIDSVKAALAQSFPGNVVQDIALLSGGLSGSLVYKVTVGDHFCTLKLNPPKQEITHIINATTLASDAGIAPKLYFDDAATGISISDFIRKEPLLNVLSPNEVVVSLAKAIRVIHDIPFHTKGAAIFDVIDELMTEFKRTNAFSGPVFAECFQYYEELKIKYPCHDSDYVFSHNDLNPNNILCDGKKIWIIDWDAANLNNRYIDLANVANYFIHTETQEHNFLQTYFGAVPTGGQMARFHAMRQLSRIVYAMFMFKLAVQAKQTDFAHDQNMDGIDIQTFGALMAVGQITLANYEGWLMYGKALMNTALHHMRAPRFSAALAQF